MKFWKSEKKTDKSWCLKLDGESRRLMAVDCETGMKIGVFLSFHDHGEVRNNCFLEGALIENGYDPYEHSNNFDGSGKLIIL